MLNDPSWSAYEIQGDPWLVKDVNTKNGKTDYCTGRHYDTVLNTQKMCIIAYKIVQENIVRHRSSSAKIKHQASLLSVRKLDDDTY